MSRSTPLAAHSPSGVVYAMAIKQLYASHYFNTTLELRFLVVDDRRAGRRGTSLISITRSRSPCVRAGGGSELYRKWYQGHHNTVTHYPLIEDDAAVCRVGSARFAHATNDWGSVSQRRTSRRI